MSENFDVFLPGHGGPVNNPSERLNFLINHRKERERQILSAIEDISLSATEITEIVYTDIDNRLISAATRNVFAHLINLNERGIVRFNGSISEFAKVKKIGK